MYTTYQIYEEIGHWMSVQELREWASINGVRKTNGYQWTSYDLNSLINSMPTGKRIKVKQYRNETLDSSELQWLEDREKESKSNSIHTGCLIAGIIIVGLPIIIVGCLVSI